MLKQVNFVVDVTDHPPQVVLLMQQHHIPPKVDLVLCQENESLNSEPVFRGARRSEPFVSDFKNHQHTVHCFVWCNKSPSHPPQTWILLCQSHASKNKWAFCGSFRGMAMILWALSTFLGGWLSFLYKNVHFLRGWEFIPKKGSLLERLKVWLKKRLVFRGF
jgi:hypothetical protein